MENIKFYKGLEKDLPRSNIEIGALYHCTDTKNTYIGTSATTMELWSNGVELGETSSTAYAGNKGAQNAADIITLQNQVKELTDLVNTLSQVQLITWED